MASAKKTDTKITIQFGRNTYEKVNGKFAAGYHWFDPIICTGVVAEAVTKLTDAKEFGMHKSETRPDVFARLRQVGIPVEFFCPSRCGTDKADFARITGEWRIVAESEVAA